MKRMTSISWLALAMAASASGVIAQAEGDAVLLRLDNDLQQVRVEAYDAEVGRWLAIASGYRDAVDTGWLKIALPEGYEQADLRIMGSPQESPFSGKISNAAEPESLNVAYPPSSVRNYMMEDVATAGGADKEAVVEEADIWAWEGSTLYFYNQYRGLQVLDMANTEQPLWLDYFRYPAKGEDLYAVGNGRVILVGSGYYWNGDNLTLQFLDFDGTSLSLTDSVEIPAGDYMDSRRYNDFLYVTTREWVQELDPDGRNISAPRIHLYTVALKDDAPERIVDVKSFDGDGWLDAVLTAQQDGILLSLNKWYNGSIERRFRWRSEVHVLVPGEDGIVEEVGVAKLSGIIQDKFKMNYHDGYLTTIAQQADWSTGQFTRATKLENFQLGDSGFTKVGSIDLAPGESLFATRFHNNNVYIVTFLFVDPLFSVNNTDKTLPVIAGELEVPGWSNYIEWVDDQLFAVGIEDSRLTVSIFDVADPAHMSLKSRVFLSQDSWAYSEAQYDDQAISFFPAAEPGMLMLPFTTWSWKSSEMIQAMQLISWDDDGLKLRGQIQHLDVPRRGVLMDKTVITISGREVVTTDVSDPDTPAESGSATLAWNVQHLIPHTDYWLQLESIESNFGYYYWRYPYSYDAQMEPVLYVTSKEEPNVPEAEIPLDSGVVLGVAHVGSRLVLLQDVSVVPTNDYWTIPETQSLAVRVYDLTDPLVPELKGEVLLDDVPYMGNKFDSQILADGTVLWHSTATPFYGIYFYDIWPGPWFYQSALSYLVSTITPEGMPAVPAYDVLPIEDYWNHASSWFWEDPVLVASKTSYSEHQKPDLSTNYEASTVLLAIDFTEPAEPVELPRVKLPANLVAINSLQDGLNHFLYFEPAYNALEVWGWDKATAFPLFKQQIPEVEGTSSYTLGWMAPFHLRNRYYYNNGLSTSHLDAWFHAADENAFKKVSETEFQNRWISNYAVKEPDFLIATYDQVNLFKGDPLHGTFELYQSANLPFPNIYALQLDKSVLTESTLYIPAGMYGVEVVPLPDINIDTRASFARLIESAGEQWIQLDSSLWQRVGKGGTDAAGAMERLQWLYHADSMHEPDPQAADAGDLWRDSTWFGWYAHFAGHPGWIHHVEHGALWTLIGGDPESTGFYLYDDELGYVWAHGDYYPFLYSFSRSQWLYYLKGSGLGAKRWFYDYGSGWFELVK